MRIRPSSAWTFATDISRKFWERTIMTGKKSRPRAGKPVHGKKAASLVDSVEAFESAILDAGRETSESCFVLKLYVTGTTPRSMAAIQNLRRLCEEHLQGRYDLEVIDIYQQPVLARGEQIIAAPTLIKKLPFPLRKVVGDLSNAERVLMGIDVIQKRA